MSIVTITTKIEFEFSAGVWTDAGAWIDNLSQIAWKRGVGADRKMYASTLTFNLDNSDETWTPGKTSSTYFNRLVKGIGVRLTRSYLGVTYGRFRGFVTDLKPVFPQYGSADLRMGVSCEGISSLLAKYENYPMALQTGQVTNANMAAIMAAVGSTLYSFETTDLYVQPYVYPKGNALGDLVALALSELAGPAWEDGLGRMRLKKAQSLVGGQTGAVASAYTSPAHTWGTTIDAEGDIQPDYRNDAQFARMAVTVGRLIPSVVDVELYRHPFNAANGTAEKLAGFQSRQIRGRFSRVPVSIVNKFVQTIAAFHDSLDDLRLNISASTTTFSTSSNLQQPNTFAVGMPIQVDSERMLVTAVTNYPAPGQWAQVVTVTRAYEDTVAVAHTGGASIYARSATRVYAATIKVLVFSNMGSGDTVFYIDAGLFDASGAGGLVAQDYVQLDSEELQILSFTPVGTNYRVAVTRALFGTTAAPHNVGTIVNVAHGLSYPSDVYGPSHIRSSADPSGYPDDKGDIVGNPSFTGGAHIVYSGIDFLAEVTNNAGSGNSRYISDLVIGGKAVQVADSPAVIDLERPIPYILGVPAGEGPALAFGVKYLEHAKGFAVGQLFAARQPAGWLPLNFTVDHSDKAVSLLSADVMDLVRYTGTDANSGVIDEWYRVMSMEGSIDADDIEHVSVLLAPADVVARDAHRCFYTTFGTRPDPLSGANLGPFDVAPQGHSGYWSNDGDWGNTLPSGSASPLQASYAIPKFGVNAPGRAVVDIGTSDQATATQVLNDFPANESFPATTGGLGVTFRSNAAGTACWEARFNRTTSKIYLWNTTDGLVASVDWTATTAPEIGVKAQGTRIRVFVDCHSEPVIDTENAALGLSSTVKNRFATQTYAGLACNRTIIANSTPKWLWWMGQGI